MKAIIKNIFLNIYKFLFTLAGIIIPKKENLVIFESFFGKKYSDNPRAIYEYMLDNFPEYRLYWSVDRASLQYFKQRKIRHVKRFTITWLLLMNRSKYWITNVRLPNWIPKPNKTIYIQTWHGTPLKKLGIDIQDVAIPGITTNEYHKEFVKDVKTWDYLISPNPYSSEIFKRAFQYDQVIIESGYPRNDVLTNDNNPEIIKSLKEKANLPLDKKIILYAPTWRDNDYYRVGKYKFDLKIDLKKLQRSLGDEYIILLRMHYLISENFDLIHYKDFVFDFSNYEDIRELYLMSDLLITDYSSVFFDYGILGRPIIFFVDDLEEYRNNIRGFYFDLEKEAPGPLVKTTDELIEAINQSVIDNEQNKNYRAFQIKYCSLEQGTASKTVVDRIFLQRQNKHHRRREQ